MRGRTIAVVSLVVVLGLGALIGGAWVASEDVRAAVRLADAWVNAPETIRPDPVALVRGVQELARLETASVQIEQHVRGQRGTDGTWSLVGERLDFVARAEVTAGVDLARLTESDLEVDAEGRVVVRLPPSEIWHVTLDEEQSFVALRERGWLGWPDAQLESRVRQEAVKAVREAAEAQGIRDRADAKAQQVVRELLEGAGVPEVRFE
ncbi:MAG: DUF4230 domain-containing protein [Myxococcota bacterium]